MTAIGVLASGSGTNFQALLDADLGDGRIAVLLVNKRSAQAAARAEAAGVPVVFVGHKDHPTREAFDRAMVDALASYRLDWIVLAGFMRLVTPTFLDAFPRRVVNVHPALLPSFPGVDAQRQALEAGVTISGCSVHLVDAGMDTGPVLAQSAVAVRPDDDVASLSRRILAEEHRLLPAVVRALCQGALVDGSRPYLKTARTVRSAALVSPPIVEGPS